MRLKLFMPCGPHNRYNKSCQYLERAPSNQSESNVIEYRPIFLCPGRDPAWWGTAASSTWWVAGAVEAVSRGEESDDDDDDDDDDARYCPATDTWTLLNITVGCPEQEYSAVILDRVV